RGYRRRESEIPCLGLAWRGGIVHRRHQHWMGLPAMSLINRMLQDLDARRSTPAAAGDYGSQVRAVAARRRPPGGIHPAWWVAALLGLVLLGVIAWLALRPGPRAPAAPAQAILPPLAALRADAIADAPAQAPSALPGT